MTSSTGATRELHEIVGEAADQFTSEIRRGGRPDVDRYARQYPEVSSILRQILPALAVLGTDAAAVEDDALPRGGQCLGDFRLLGEIGRGGMGVVYEAEQISLGRRIAVKVLPFAAMLDNQQLARFKNEARAAASLDHPHIVGIYFVGCDRGVHYYAMPFVDGMSLDRVIAGLRTDAGRQSAAFDATSVDGSAVANRVDLRDTERGSLLSTQRTSNRAEFYRTVAQLGIEAAEALHHAHELGVVHRDVKPGNLLVDSSGKLWVTDFGLARIEGNGNLTLTGDLLGTLRYTSPEQALGARVGVDHRTDIYSLGATLYELIALEPVVAGQDRATILQGLGAAPIPLHAHDQQVPSDLETILLKSIERDPSDRYATAQELADDLRRFYGRQSIYARRPTVTRRLANQVRRYPQLSLVIGLSCVVVSLTASLAAWSIDRAQRETAFQRSAAEQREQLQLAAEAQVREHVYVKSMQLIGLARQEKNLGQVRHALDGLAPQPGEPDLRGFEWHYLSNLCRNTPQPFGKHQGEAYAASISPDDKQLATAGSDGVRIWAWPSHTELKHLREAEEDVGGIAWSPDGARLVSFSDDWHVRVYQTRDWSIEESFKLPGPLVAGCFTPDGRSLLVAERRQSVGDGTTEGHNVVHVYDCATWKPRGTLTGLTQMTHAVSVSSDGRFAAAAADDSVCVWDLLAMRLLHCWPHPGAHCAEFSPDAPVLAVSFRNEIRFYDIPSGKLQSTLSGVDRPEGIAFGGDDRTVITVGRGQVAQVWRLASDGAWKEVSEFVHSQSLWGVCVDQDGLIVTTDGGGGVWVWHSKAGQDQRRVIASPEYVERWLNTMTSDATPTDEFAAVAKRWSHVEPPLKTSIATAIAWSPHRREAVVASARGELTLWDAEFRQPLGQLATAISGACNIAWSPDGHWIAISGTDSLALVERESLRLVSRTKFGDFGAPLLTFSKDGSAVFAAWRRSTSKPFRSMAAYHVPSLEESPSDVPVAWQFPWDACVTTGADLAFLFEGRQSRELEAAASEIRAGNVVSFVVSLDQQTVALSKAGGNVEVVQAIAWPSRVQIATSVRRHEKMMLTPNGRTLAILHDTGEITLWSTVTGQQYFGLNARLQATEARFSPDGTKLVAIGHGPSVSEEIVVWDAAPGPPPHLALHRSE